MTFEEFGQLVSAKLRERGLPLEVIHVAIAAWRGSKSIAVLAPYDNHQEHAYLGFATEVVQMPLGSTLIKMDEDTAETTANEIVRRVNG